MYCICSLQNAETPQLWAELQTASGYPVNSVMETWTQQMGFPLVRVQARQKGPDRFLLLSQSKFTASGKQDKSGALWKIPISILRAGQAQPLHVLLDQQQMEVRLSGVSPTDWVKLNPGFLGFYRVAYGPQELEQLCAAVSTAQLSQIDRQALCTPSTLLPIEIFYKNIYF